MLDIPYEVWEDAYKRNIRPLPIWWNCEENKRKEYEEFTRFCATGRVDYDKS